MPRKDRTGNVGANKQLAALDRAEALQNAGQPTNESDDRGVPAIAAITQLEMRRRREALRAAKKRVRKTGPDSYSNTY